MKNVKVLGSGCAKCHATVELVKQAAAAAGVVIELEKVEDMAAVCRLWRDEYAGRRG